MQERKCNTLIETNIQGEPIYRDEKGKKYTDIESFHNKIHFRKLKSRKVKGNTPSPREEERIIKVRITSRKEEEKGEKCKEVVIEMEPRQEITHASND